MFTSVDHLSGHRCPWWLCALFSSCKSSFTIKVFGEVPYFRTFKPLHPYLSQFPGLSFCIRGLFTDSSWCRGSSNVGQFQLNHFLEGCVGVDHGPCVPLSCLRHRVQGLKRHSGHYLCFSSYRPLYDVSRFNWTIRSLGIRVLLHPSVSLYQSWSDETLWEKVTMESSEKIGTDEDESTDTVGGPWLQNYKDHQS